MKLKINSDLPGVTDDLFLHPSQVHGSGHVNRVIVIADLLVQTTGLESYRKSLWASAYLHDLARHHDGCCEEHGPRAAEERMDEFKPLFIQHGVENFDHVFDAVSWHSKNNEPPKDHVNYTAIALLKDADALDRFRIDDFDPTYLRFKESHRLIELAQDLFSMSYQDEVDSILEIREIAKYLISHP